MCTVSLMIIERAMKKAKVVFSEYKAHVLFYTDIKIYILYIDAKDFKFYPISYFTLI